MLVLCVMCKCASVQVQVFVHSVFVGDRWLRCSSCKKQKLSGLPGEALPRSVVQRCGRVVNKGDLLRPRPIGHLPTAIPSPPAHALA